MYNSPTNHSNGMTQQHQQQQQRLAKQQSFRPTMHRQQPPSPSSQSPSPSSSSSGPRAKCDQVVFEAIAKAAEIVVASRCWIGSNSDAGGGASQTGSGRFNLLVPEVKSVRTILQRWKRTMHVPLRLDVYYQHPPTPQHESGERELLERWCLEYAPSTSTSTSTAGHYDGYNNHGDHHHQGVDPIVQLRTVCKNIVVWLRTLYCQSRLLPAQALRKSNCHANSNIGFSIYVVGEGKDDVSGLLKQGFDSEPKYSTGCLDGVPTPYGILGWRVYLAPRSLIRKLMALEKEQAKLLRPPVEHHYSNTHLTKTTSSSPSRAIPVRTSFSHANSNGNNDNNNNNPPVARSAPSRGYRRSNSDSIAAHTHRDPSYLHQQQQQQQQNRQQEYQPQQQQQQQQQQQTENPRYYSRSPNTQSAPRSYHHQGEFHNRYTEHSFSTNTTRGIYGGETTTNKNTNESSSSSPSPKRKNGGIGGNKNKNLSALSLALMTMKDDNNNNNNNNKESSQPYYKETSTMNTAADDETSSASPGKESGNELLSFPEKRRAALHNAPPTVVAAATGVGEYGYAYNNHHPHSTGQQQQQHPNLSSSPASITPTQGGCFKGPSTPASSTLGTTPPGYLLSATPSVGSHGTSYGTTGFLIPPKSAVGHAPPPFVRPLGFAGQAPEAPESGPLPDASQQQQQNSPSMLHPKPSLDLLHSSPFHHSASGLHDNPNNATAIGGGGASHQKDGLSSFLQAEETASMEAATTFINDFYHHHYPMAAASSEHDHHHLASTDEYYNHHHQYQYHHSGEASFLEPDLLQADDMPFAVEGFSSSPSKLAAAGSLLKSPMTNLNEASLMVASMGMVPQKKLALFEQSSSSFHNNNNNYNDNGNDNDHGAEATAGNTVSSQQCGVDKNNDVSVDDLTDQLADFRSFGATLSSPPLTTSVGSGG